MAGTSDRITQTPDILAARATVRGLRISVAHVVNLVANGMTPAQIEEELPDGCGFWRMLESRQKTIEFLTQLRHEAIHVRTGLISPRGRRAGSTRQRHSDAAIP